MNADPKDSSIFFPGCLHGSFIASAVLNDDSYAMI